MKREEFFFQLQKATNKAAEFAEEYIINDVVRNFKYNVTLISPLKIKETNGTKEHIEQEPEKKFGVDIHKAVELIYRDGKVPRWIDINVIKTKRRVTIVKLVCSRDYSGKKEDLYYTLNGTEPFGIKSPLLPADYIEGKKFKLK